MKKRVLGIVATAAFAIAAVSAPVAADPNPDSAAGLCGPGIGDAAQDVNDYAKLIAELFDMPLGQVKQDFPVVDGQLLVAGQLISEFCAPGQQ